MKSERRWDGLPIPDSGNLFNARRETSSESLWYAVDRVGRRHLLIDIGKSVASARVFETRGVTADIEILDPAQVGPQSWIDIACTDSSINETFAVLAGQLAADLDGASDRLRTVRSTLDAWRWFWSNRPGPLSDEDEIGLFGELWFLHRWLSRADSLRWWRGPLGNRHDFVSPDVSVEVKATSLRTDGPARHQVSNLDQLDSPLTGSLLLFSVIAVRDELSANSLAGMIDLLTTDASNRGVLPLWQQLLDAAGWHVAYADRYRSGLRVVSEELYRVDGTFPRIIRSSFVGGHVPVGVDDIRYSIDLAGAVASHRIATGAPAAVLRPLC